jgi:hypothetical protein
VSGPVGRRKPFHLFRVLNAGHVLLSELHELTESFSFGAGSEDHALEVQITHRAGELKAQERMLRVGFAVLG